LKRAIRTHIKDFIAILALVVLALAVSVYVLSHERLRFPWSSSPYTIKAEFSSLQAVTPGQGQTVRISGVQVGDVGQVTLKDGITVVQLDIQDKYKHLITRGTTALLRPRTGLKDMFIELTPAPPSAGQAPENYTIPVSNTNPDVNPDEILAALDADTRSYLQLLINGAGAGLQYNGGNELAKVFVRFLPTHRDLARLNSVVAERGADLRSLVHSLQVLNTAVAAKRHQVVQLIDASSKVFRGWAAAGPNIGRAVADLPGALQQTTSTLLKVQRFSNVLAPAATSLIPAVRLIPNANNATASLARAVASPGHQVIRDQIRPFVVAARPLVRNLAPASTNLAKATPNLSRVFVVLNHLFNDLGYSPGGGQHGYLYWLAWGDHNARSVFGTQDANGDFRQLFLQFSCASLSQVVSNIPGSESVLGVTGILTSNTTCPTQAAANRAAFARYQQQNPHLATQTQSSPSLANGAAAAHLFYPNLPTK
jgi:phospholipid/cholesterol/gamma-HCH transport system substrate-binding protein